ncbi:methyltransferase domain-containing protein [Candidatus Woesearchaeota archaeon]|nr:methyltransferase domain-containing protein [Candidatus Woesearchaeota archaeon]
MKHKLFDSIKSEYASYVQSLLGKGKLPLFDTKIGFWGPSSIDEAYRAFHKLKLKQFRSFIDIGSGDGRVTLLASLFCESAHGIEYHEGLHQKAIEIAQKLGMGNVRFFNKDFHEHDLSAYEAIFINPDKPLSRGTEQKLLKEMKGKLIVMGNHFHPEKLAKEREIDVDGMKFSLYSGV